MGQEFKNKITVVDRKAVASRESEMNCIGLSLTDIDALHEISGTITEADFYWEEHKKIFAVLLNLLKNGVHIDPITVGNELDKKGQLESVGGNVYLSTLADIAINKDKITTYAKIVRDWSVLREVVRTNNETNQKITSGEIENPLEIIDSQNTSQLNLSMRLTKGSLTSTKDLYEKTLDRIEDAIKNQRDILGIRTGLTSLDRITLGYQRGEYIVVGARTSVGKSAFAIQSAVHVAMKEKLPTAVFSLEMSEEQVMLRILSNVSRISALDIRKGNLSKYEQQHVLNCLKEIRDSPIFIDSTSGLTVTEIRAKTNKLIKSHGEFGLVIVDYINILSSSNNKSSDSYSTVGGISLELKNFAKDINTPVLVPAQLNRSKENQEEKRPRMSDMADSDRINRDSDTIILIYRPQYYDTKKESHGGGSSGSYSSRNNQVEENSPVEDDMAELIVEKARNGTTGMVKVGFDKKCTRFFD